MLIVLIPFWHPLCSFQKILHRIFAISHFICAVRIFSILEKTLLVHSCWERFLFMCVFLEQCSFTFCHQRRVLLYATSRDLLSYSANLLWMKLIFLNQNPYIPSWAGVFQFAIFLSVALRVSRYILLSVIYLSPSKSFSISFTQAAFLSYFSVLIWFKIYFVSFASGHCFVLEHSPPSC